MILYVTQDGNGIFAWSNEWPVYYTNWDTNEPSQTYNKSERCVAMKGDKRWAVVDCSTKLAFVCRVDNSKLTDIKTLIKLVLNITRNFNLDKPPTKTSNISGICPKSKVEGKEWVDLDNDVCYHLEQGQGGKWADAAKSCADMGNVY